MVSAQRKASLMRYLIALADSRANGGPPPETLNCRRYDRLRPKRPDNSLSSTYRSTWGKACRAVGSKLGSDRKLRPIRLARTLGGQ